MMSSPNKSVGGSAREGTRIVLREITATLQNSPPTLTSRLKSGNDTSHPKTPEHEVKVRFAREFADVESNTCLSSEPLSPASSFHSISSALSTKSSSGICADSPYNDIIATEIANNSYLNANIPGLDDLITACDGLHLHEDNNQFPGSGAPDTVQDQSLDQTFTSATEDSVIDLTQVISTETNDNEKTLNSTCSIDDCRKAINERPILTTLCIREPLPVVLYAPNNRIVLKAEESTEKSISLNKTDNVRREFETCIIADDFQENALPDSNDSKHINSNLIKCSLPDRSSSDQLKPEEDVLVQDTSTTETLSSPNDTSCPTIGSIKCDTSLLENVEESSLPSIPTISSLTELTHVTFSETDADVITENQTNLLSRSSSPEINTSALAIALAEDVLKSPVIQVKKHKNVSLTESLVPNPCNIKRELIPANDLNSAPIVRPNSPQIPKSLEPNAEEKFEFETEAIVAPGIESFEEKDSRVADHHTSNQGLQLLENVKSEEPSVVEKAEISKEVTEPANVSKEEGKDECSANTTITLQEISFNLETEQDIEQYAAFQPQRQSTTLALTAEQPDFIELKSAAEKVADDIINSTVELAEESDRFASATSEIFQDPTSFDFFLTRCNSKNIDRLRTESLYVKFDPLVRDNSIMLPQGNVQPINEEPSGKNENPLPNEDTPKRNPALAAIDRLLYFSPISTGTIQKTENPQEKIEQPTEESKQETALNTDVNMSKELELVRVTVLQLEEKLEKQKKEYEAELEKQKTALHDKINKLQTQMAQEVKSKSQMTVVVEEYEKSISRLLTERERDRTNFEQEKTKLQEELQATNVHLTNTEAAFNDVHQKYERLKGVVSAYKSNETVLKESIQENMETIKGLETRYDQLKNHAMAQLEKANFELDGIRKQHEDETVKLHALIRKAELKSNSFAELVEQKTKENKELTQILDEVIARVGHQNAE